MEWFRSKVDHQIELEWKGTSRMELHESKWNIMEWFRSTWNRMDIMDQFGKEENHLDQTDLKWNWNHIEIEWNFLDQVGTEWNNMELFG